MGLSVKIEPEPGFDIEISITEWIGKVVMQSIRLALTFPVHVRNYRRDANAIISPASDRGYYIPAGTKNVRFKLSKIVTCSVLC